jgi:CcmD family protein
MGEAAVVNLAFAMTFGIIVWYAARLHFRHRRLSRELDQNRG